MVMKVAVRHLGLPRIPVLLRVLPLGLLRTPVLLRVPHLTPVRLPALALATLVPALAPTRVANLALAAPTRVANLALAALARVVSLAPLAIRTLLSFLIPIAVNSSTPVPGRHFNRVKEASSIQVKVNSWTPARRTSSTAKGLNPLTPASSSSSIREKASSWMRTQFNFSIQTLVGL